MTGIQKAGTSLPPVDAAGGWVMEMTRIEEEP
jgi:hypothetical protein